MQVQQTLGQRRRREHDHDGDAHPQVEDEGGIEQLVGPNFEEGTDDTRSRSPAVAGAG